MMRLAHWAVVYALWPMLVLAQTDIALSRDVEVELVLAVDTSASVSNEEFELQMVGIANAFRHPEVITAIESYGGRGIAVTLVQWSSGHQQVQTVPWHHVHDRFTAGALAAEIAGSRRMFGINTTAIGSALRFSARLFANNGYDGRRQTIDVSGDGRSNAGLIAATERDRVVAAGIIVNGLAILNGDNTLRRYYEINVIGGRGSFVDTAADFQDFARAIRDKLIREISPMVSEAPARTRTAQGR